MELLGNEGKKSNEFSDYQILSKYNKILDDARKRFAWGGEYQILAIATFLQSEIYIYNTFPYDLKFHQNCSSTLIQCFRNDSDIIGKHLKYLPMTHNSTGIAIKRILFGFFDKNHFTAIIPRNEKLFIFKPSRSRFDFD